MTEQLFLAYGKVSLTTAVFIAALLLLAPLLRHRYAARWRHMIWLLLAVRLVLPFQIDLPRAPIRVPVPQVASGNAVSRGDTVPIVGEVDSGEAAQTPAELTPTAIAAAVWLAGAVVFLALQAGAYLVFLCRLRRAGRQAVPQAVAAIWVEMGRQRRLHGPPELIVTDAVQAPVLAGVLRPRLLLPPGVECTPPTELALVFRHELVHHRRRDLWFKLLLLLANAVHWYNPLVYLMANRSSRDIELSCDDAVIRELGEGAIGPYSDTIVSHLPRGRRRIEGMLTTQFGSDKKSVKQRLTNLFDRRVKRRGIVPMCLVALAAVIATGAVAYTPALAAGNDGQTPEEYFAQYLPHGLVYDGEGDALAYLGKPVRLYVCFREGGSFEYLRYFDAADGALCLEGLQNATGRATGVRELSPEIARDLLADLAVALPPAPDVGERPVQIASIAPDEVVCVGSIELDADSDYHYRAVAESGSGLFVGISPSSTARSLNGTGWHLVYTARDHGPVDGYFSLNKQTGGHTPPGTYYIYIGSAGGVLKNVTGGMAPAPETPQPDYEFVTFDATSIVGELGLTATDHGITKDSVPAAVRHWIGGCDGAGTGAYLYSHKTSDGYESYLYYNGGGRYPFSLVNDGGLLRLNLVTDRMKGIEGYTLIRLSTAQPCPDIAVAVGGKSVAPTKSEEESS